MTKLHNLSYGDYFGTNFQTSALDENLVDLELEEKLMLLDNVIDYLYVNFKALASPEKKEQGEEEDGEFGSDEEKEYEVDGGGIVGKKPLSKIEAMKKVQMNKKLVAEKALTKKLLRKGIPPSMSLSYKKQQIQLVVEGEKVRKIKREEAKTLVRGNQRESNTNPNKA